MKILVTGHKGYIGSHLVDILKQEGDSVTGCDLGVYEGCEFDAVAKPDIEWRKDIRNLTAKELEGFDCVMHLAAISNDPMGDIDPSLTYSINRDGSVNLARSAKQAGVPRFLFAGSCSVYGKGEKLDLDEEAAFNPVSAYAVSKVEAEAGIKKLADENFSPSILRNSTAYGYSPMLRIDLVVNNLLACAFTRGDIRIMSDGTPWRPLIHCRDIARAFNAFAKAPKEAVHNRSVNIGANTENYQVKDVAGLVKKLIPGAGVVFTGEVGADPRNYRVNFDLLYSLLPDFKLQYGLESGMEELYRYFKQKNFSIADFEGDKYIRLKWLKKNLHNRINGNDF